MRTFPEVGRPRCLSFHEVYALQSFLNTHSHAQKHEEASKGIWALLKYWYLHAQGPLGSAEADFLHAPRKSCCLRGLLKWVSLKLEELPKAGFPMSFPLKPLQNGSLTRQVPRRGAPRSPKEDFAPCLLFACQPCGTPTTGRCHWKC